MNDHHEPKWPAVVFFTICGLFFCSCVGYLWAGARNPEYHWQNAPAASPSSTRWNQAAKERILLTKNSGARVGNDRIVYRGSGDGDLYLELFVLQLDPHYGYPHRIDAQKARKGFRMGDHLFRVLAASDGKISLKRL